MSSSSDISGARGRPRDAKTRFCDAYSLHIAVSLRLLPPMDRLRLPFALWALWVATATAQADPARFVNTLTGTANGGHVFAGATLPWGSVKAGADSASGDNQAGYVSDGSPITGISQLHDDGTGGGASLGNFPLLPYNSSGCPGNDLTRCVLDRNLRAVPHGNPTVSPGYFSIPFNSGIKAEVTVTQHVTLHRFTFPDDMTQENLLLEVTGDLSRSFRSPGNVTVSPNPATNGTRATGMGTFGPSFGHGSYQVFFCLDTAVPFVDGRFFAPASGSTAYTVLSTNGTFTAQIDRAPGGLLFGFPKMSSVNVRVGISWTSAAKACAYAQEEIPDIAGFDAIKNAARAKWNDVLRTVQVDSSGVDPEVQELFWTALYRTYISPTNITGDNPLWVSTEPFYDSLYCIWDSFRVVHPLYAITAPKTQAEVVRALIDIYRNTGFLPDCRMSLDKGLTQGGSNADSLLSDSFVKGIKAGIDWGTGYAAMVKDATVEGDYSVEGRGRDRVEEQAGGPRTRSASRLLEYAYNDFSIGLVAQGLDKPADAAHYFNASRDWANIWNPNASHAGFSGFIQPRNADGSWFFDPRWDVGGVFRPDHCSPVFGHFDCFLNEGGGEFYEASSWEYSFYVPHDMARLVRLMGGKDTVSSRLDTFFEKNFHDIGDEPGFLPTYLYNYIGQPAKTVDRVDATLKQYYNNSVNGLPGNDDSGAMGAYVVWSHLGFFPVAGQDTYLLNRPYFPKITIRNEVTGTTATIIAENLSEANKYVQAAMLNGRRYTRNWISHEIFRTGGTLRLVMGPSPSAVWGTGEADLPPSLSTGGFRG
ncbi:Glycoside hydrolase family 92 protein [Mycena kentingensis (nom. inval.)]|nr:Glycoside hydrolase family 92 protein [Mycena kentingensis (nom. inval.)]